VKFLGALLGRQVLVFNCDDGLDFESMGQIFIGIVMTGAWGCFDEFNRLKEEQLSAIANQIQQIQNAIKNKLESVMLLSKKITVNTHAALFVTLNPVGKDYGGRSELPSNLKVLFRPIAMSLPDDRKIAEVTLLASGFHNARELGMKACFILSSSRSFLSPQKHYDWGLRALMAVLRTTTKIIQNTHINQGDLLHWEVC
jgi:dynein heavy chain 2